METLCGPIPEEFRTYEANQRAWGDFWPWAEEHVAQQQFPCAADWLKKPPSRRLADSANKGDAAIAMKRVRHACAVLTQLLPDG